MLWRKILLLPPYRSVCVGPGGRSPQGRCQGVLVRWPDVNVFLSVMGLMQLLIPCWRRRSQPRAAVPCWWSWQRAGRVADAATVISRRAMQTRTRSVPTPDGWLDRLLRNNSSNVSRGCGCSSLYVSCLRDSVVNASGRLIPKKGRKPVCLVCVWAGAGISPLNCSYQSLLLFYQPS